MTQAITSDAASRNNPLLVAAGGALSGILTPLLPQLIDQISGTPGDFRIALVAVPFALLVLILVRRYSANPWWAAVTAAVVTMIAFVLAVNAAIFIDGGGGRGQRREKYFGWAYRWPDRFGRHGARDWSAAIRSARSHGMAADAGRRHRGRRAAGARQCARSRPDLGALSGLAGMRRGDACEGVAADEIPLTLRSAVRHLSHNLGPRRSAHR